MIVDEWGAQWRIDPRALQDLRMRFAAWGTPELTTDPTGSETNVQNAVRLEAGQRGDILLYRNNVGALTDSRGVPVRYGLANDTAKLNGIIKSADLIGIYRRLITPEDVGTYVGQFISVENKHAGWTYSGQGREPAQLNWNTGIAAFGGYARFYAGEPGGAFATLPRN